MSIYRADPKDGVAWVTGASTGIGRALALDLARDGFTVAVTSRPQDPVDDLLAEAAGMRGRIQSFPCDVTDEAGMARVVTQIEAQAGPIVLAVFNAGIYLPVQGEDMEMRSFRATYEVNLFGVLNGLLPVVERMRSRSRGHVVLMGSVTAYNGWPTTGAYGATKAALNNMAEALRFDFAKMNIRIQIMNPGFIDTPLVAEKFFTAPALMPLPKASARLLAAIRRGGYETTFPRRFTWWMRLVRLLPANAAFMLMNYITQWKGRPLMPGRHRARAGEPTTGAVELPKQPIRARRRTARK